ncbi:GDP-mannose 4,6-dehydratase [candidate division WOR-3 bacterium]|nr:GDP-mannose 4,6-dehydratase [candidate division WOR-3 bacterium]
MKKVLVTGGAGFIGSWLAEALVKKGYRVKIVDNLSNGSVNNLDRVKNSIEFYKIDAREQNFLNLILKENFEIIFHLAGISYVPPSIKNPWSDFQNTLLPTFKILDCIRKNALKSKLIIASSAAVYGNLSKTPIKEQDTLNPISPYGVTRLAIEKYASVFSNLYQINVLSLRFFSTYGPRQKKQVVYDFIKKLSRNPKELVILGNGKQVRDLVYVKDVVDAIIKTAINGQFNGEAYNVATGVGITIVELAKLIEKIMGVNPKYKFTGSIRLGDPEKWIADISKIRKLGYKPHYSLKEGLDETINWYFKNFKT